MSSLRAELEKERAAKAKAVAEVPFLNFSGQLFFDVISRKCSDNVG